MNLRQTIMPLPVDTSTFQLAAAPDEDPEEVELLEAFAREAREHIESRPWAPPITDLLLAYGVGGILGLFLVRFESDLGGEIPGERERWVVVGDMPTMNFETEDAPTQDLALQLYCAIAQDWADNVLAGRDLSDSYPIPVAPTQEHAEMLKSRVKFIRNKIIPVLRREARSRSAVQTSSKK